MYRNPIVASFATRLPLLVVGLRTHADGRGTIASGPLNDAHD
ncbi:hypothetical protein ACWCYZ_39295 [Streptomyces virginiae]